MRLVRPAVLLGACGLLLGSAAQDTLGSWQEPTFRREYRFFVSVLPAVPPSCRLVAPSWVGDLGLAPPRRVTAFLRQDLAWVTTESGPEGCVLYWRPAACAARGKEEPISKSPSFRACRDMESRLRLEPFATARLPAQPGFKERYIRKDVLVGFFRVVGVTAPGPPGPSGPRR